MSKKITGIILTTVK